MASCYRPVTGWISLVTWPMLLITSFLVLRIVAQRIIWYWLSYHLCSPRSISFIFVVIFSALKPPFFISFAKILLYDPLQVHKRVQPISPLEIFCFLFFSGLAQWFYKWLGYQSLGITFTPPFYACNSHSNLNSGQQNSYPFLLVMWANVSFHS